MLLNETYSCLLIGHMQKDNLKTIALLLPTKVKYGCSLLKFIPSRKEIGHEEPYYDTKISIFSFTWAGLAAFHKASTI